MPRTGQGGAKGVGMMGMIKKKTSSKTNPHAHTRSRPPPAPQASAWHNYSRSLSMAALRMRVTRDRRASGCRSAGAAVPSSGGKGETASRIPAQSHLHAAARTGEERAGGSIASHVNGGNHHPNQGRVPQPLLARSPAQHRSGSAAFVPLPSSLPSSHTHTHTCAGYLHLVLDMVPRQVGSAWVGAHIPVGHHPTEKQAVGHIGFASPWGFCRTEKSPKIGR